MIRIGPLIGTALAAALYLTVGNVGVGRASDVRPTPAAPTPAAAETGAYLVLTASGLAAQGLTYVGTFAVARPGGDVEILRFRMASGSLDTMAVTQACSGAVTTVTSADSAAFGSTTFDAVSLAVTVAGTPVTFTVASPPDTAFPNDIELADVTLAATTLSAETLTTPAFTTRAVSC